MVLFLSCHFQLSTVNAGSTVRMVQKKVPPNFRVDLRVTFAQKPNLQKRFGLVRLSNDPDPRQQTDKCFASAFCLFVCLNTLAIRHRIV